MPAVIETKGTLTTGNHFCASGGTADALASGASVRKGVGVQIPPRAQYRVTPVDPTGVIFLCPRTVMCPRIRPARAAQAGIPAVERF